VVGKAFYDAKHQKVSTPNRRRDKPNVTVWEIHPVMRLTVVNGVNIVGKWEMTSGHAGNLAAHRAAGCGNLPVWCRGGLEP
jgi:hypothetical protein